MDKREKTNLLLNGLASKLRSVKLKSSERNKLLNSAIGLKFKLIRLERNITAEAVVQDNKEVISDVHSLYKFEQGFFHFGKLYALTNYYDVDVNDLFKLTER